MISPNTSGLILTSTSGWTFPVAVTVWTIVLTTAFSVVTETPTFAVRFIAMARPTRAATSTQPPITHHFALDFLRGLATDAAAVAFPGERAAVMGAPFTAVIGCRSIVQATPLSLPMKTAWGGAQEPPHANTTNNEQM